jgi:segregation and condensation protein B
MQNLNLFEKEIEKSHSATSQSRKVEIKRILEALLFSSSEPVPFDKLKEIISSTYPLTRQELKDLIADLSKDYKALNRSFQIDEIGGGYLLRTIKEMQPYLEMLHFGARGEKLSKACSEVLAIIAYKQAAEEHFATRAEIEKLRGVDSSGTLASLLERELVEVVGRLEQPGRPSQYGITKRFLRHFGLKDFSELKSHYQS